MRKHFEFDEETEAYLNKIGHGVNDLLKALREITEKKLGDKAVMLSDDMTLDLVKVLIKAANIKTIVELGVFTGYGTLYMAQVLAEGGKILACDISEEWMKIGYPFWEKAGVANKIEPKIGPGLETLRNLEDQSVDMIYLDANKDQYLEYGQAAAKKLRIGGLLIVDNTLFGGKVLNKADHEASTEGVRKLNTMLSESNDFDIAPLSISDGVTLAYKR
jgi:predicted O-methyltransferase YrrM